MSPERQALIAIKPSLYFSRTSMSTWVYSKSFGKTYGYNFHQIFVSRIIFLPKAPYDRDPNPSLPVCQTLTLWQYIFHTQVWVYSIIDGFLVKINNSVHYTMVGYCYTVHSQLFCTPYEVLYSVCPVQKTVFSMDMKVYKISATLSPFVLSSIGIFFGIL